MTKMKTESIALAMATGLIPLTPAGAPIILGGGAAVGLGLLLRDRRRT